METHLGPDMTRLKHKMLKSGLKSLKYVGHVTSIIDLCNLTVTPLSTSILLISVLHIIFVLLY